MTNGPSESERQASKYALPVWAPALLASVEWGLKYGPLVGSYMVCVYIYMYVYVYIHIHIYTHVHLHYMCICIYRYMYMSLYIYKERSMYQHVGSRVSPQSLRVGSAWLCLAGRKARLSKLGSGSAVVGEPERPHKHRDLTFWFQGPKSGGPKKSCLVGSLCLCCLLGPQ